MFTIYKAQINSNWIPLQYQNLLSQLPPIIATKIAQYKNPKDQQSRILAKLMLQRLLLDFQLPFTLSQLTYTHSNKPQFPYSGFDFSTAHSGDLILCGGLLDTMRHFEFPATSHQLPATQPKLGIDLELMDNHLDLSLYQDYLTPTEWAFIHHSPNILRAFYSIWTRKEAFAKAIGRGIDLVFRHHDLSDYAIDYQNNTYYIYDLNIDSEYIGAVVCTNQLEINIIDFKI